MVTMIITLSLTALLAVVFVFIMMPRNKYNMVDKSHKILIEGARLAKSLCNQPSLDDVKKLHKMLAKAANYLSYSVFSGISELKPIEDIVVDIAETAKSLFVVKADDAKIKKYSAIMLTQLGGAISKMLPFVRGSKADGKLTLSAKSKAEAHLASIAPDDDKV